MQNTVVLYSSKYGSTKKYAEWLSKDLSCDVLETKNAKIESIKKYDNIILGGGIYASGIKGLSFLKKNFSSFANKKIAIFCVGASPFDKKAVEQIKTHNLTGELNSIPLFYCRGAFLEDKMTFMDKTLCGMLKKSVAKKDPSTYEPWMKALMESIGSSHDWTDKENIKPIIDYIRS